LKSGANRLVLAIGCFYLVFWALVSFYPSPVDGAGFMPDVVANILNLTGYLGLSNIINYGFLEGFANVLFYVPIGLIIAAASRGLPLWQKLYFAFAISLAAETLQGIFISRRVSSWLDVWHNLLGAALGLMLMQLAESRSQRYLLRQ
jgi:glycopeptide antibiotics resistance protein